MELMDALVGTVIVIGPVVDPVSNSVVDPVVGAVVGATSVVPISIGAEVVASAKGDG